MKFIYADSLDVVDPTFDFIKDTYTPNRAPYWDDHFTHEMFKKNPYDGVLVSRATVGEGSGDKSRYSAGQSLRFTREGARRFLRLDKARFKDLWIFGDNGAFSYAKDEHPPFSVQSTVDFYEESGFTHGCSVDHIVFQFGKHEEGSQESKRRFELTLSLASEFLKIHKASKANFIPVGVVQGWSPESLKDATGQLLKMGYRYLAIGGLVPLRIPEIKLAVQSVSEALNGYADGQIHLLGFAKTDYISELAKYKVVSFDSASPMVQAFKDSSRNYWFNPASTELIKYSAIRVPQATENLTLVRAAKSGLLNQERLIAAEKRALSALRSVDRLKTKNFDPIIKEVLEYSTLLFIAAGNSESLIQRKVEKLRTQYAITLKDRPWDICGCDICIAIGIEAIIFRGSNRNKRRGMHNIKVLHSVTKKLRENY